MTDTSSTVHTVEHGNPSELPAIVWKWRRWFIFPMTAALCFHVWSLTRNVTDIATLREVIRNDQGLIFVLVFIYIAGATATDIVSLVSALRSTRKVTTTTAAPPSSLTTTSAPGGGTVTTAETPPSALLAQDFKPGSVT